MTTTGSAASVGPLGCGDKPEGLKMHISTALSGLLDRTLNNRLGSSASGELPPRRLPPAHTSELAKEMREMIMQPIPARTALLRAAERAAGVSEVEPYACFYCEWRFEQESTLNRHMGMVHKEYMICPSLRLEELEDDPDGGNDTDHKSKPSVTGSLASECPVGSDGWPMTTGMVVAAGAGGGPSEFGAAAEDSGKHAPVAHVAEGQPASKSPTGFATSVPQPGCSDNTDGLKTKISTAFGGLLERALVSRLEKGLDTRNRQTPKEKVPHPASESASSPPGRARRVYNTELVRQVQQKMSVKLPRTARKLPRVTAGAGTESGLYPYMCLYCPCRFEQQRGRRMHILAVHKNERTLSKESEPELGPDDASRSEGSDRDCGAPQKVVPHHGVERDLPEFPLPESSPTRCVSCGKGAVCDEAVERKVMAALCELAPRGHWWRGRGRSRGRGRGCRGPGPGTCPLPVPAREWPDKEKTGSLLSPRQEIEVIFVNEETPFLDEAELPDGHDNARDPLSLEEETGEFSFCEVQRIKKEDLEDPVAVSEFNGCIKVDPELDLQMDVTDSKVYSDF